MDVADGQLFRATTSALHAIEFIDTPAKFLAAKAANTDTLLSVFMLRLRLSREPLAGQPAFDLDVRLGIDQ